MPEIAFSRDSFDRLRVSSAWSPRWEMPTFPLHRNPMIYLAQALTLYRPVPDTLMKAKFGHMAYMCDGGRRRLGLPEMVSHDEIYGFAVAARLLGMVHLAYPIMAELRRNGGRLDLFDGIENNFYRIGYMEAVMNKLEGNAVTPYQAVIYGFAIVLSTISKGQPSYSGLMRSWMSIQFMKDEQLAAPFIFIFGLILKIRRISLEHVMAVYHGDCPEMADSVRYMKRGWLD